MVDLINTGSFSSHVWYVDGAHVKCCPVCNFMLCKLMSIKIKCIELNL